MVRQWPPLYRAPGRQHGRGTIAFGTRGMLGGAGDTDATSFIFTAPELVWVSDETVAVAVFQITIDADIEAGAWIYGEASLTADFAAPFDTTEDEILAPDLADDQIDSFAFGAFSDAQTIYVRVRALDGMGGNPITGWSNTEVKTMVLSSAPSLDFSQASNSQYLPLFAGVL